jgi:hypothetical protein
MRSLPACVPGWCLVAVCRAAGEGTGVERGQLTPGAAARLRKADLEEEGSGWGIDGEMEAEEEAVCAPQRHAPRHAGMR